jgi:uncharacterized protein
VSTEGGDTHAVAWRWLDETGLEHCRLSEGAGPRIQGTVVALSNTTPWRIDYEVRCERTWHTRSVTVEAHEGTEARTLALAVDELLRWTVRDGTRPDLEGCLDVDLGFSPSTNTLPIRRLGLSEGQAATIEAAWVEFPSLKVHRVPQRYTRLGERTYRYENLPTGFVAEVEVDARGIVVFYPPGWERIGLHEP